MIDISHSFFKLLKYNCFLNNPFNFPDCFILVSKFDNLLVLFGDLFDSLHNNWNFHNLFNYLLDVSVHINKLRNNFFNFNYARNLN
jgi:hypothetical protein